MELGFVGFWVGLEFGGLGFRVCGFRWVLWLHKIWSSGFCGLGLSIHHFGFWVSSLMSRPSRSKV